jgi:hypothetical protein
MTLAAWAIPILGLLLGLFHFHRVQTREVEKEIRELEERQAQLWNVESPCGAVEKARREYAANQERLDLLERRRGSFLGRARRFALGRRRAGG